MQAEILPTQIAEIRFYLRGHRRSMKELVRRCQEKNICSRSTTFDAVTPELYDETNPLHRLAVAEAIKFLSEVHDVTFPWAELKPIEA